MKILHNRAKWFRFHYLLNNLDQFDITSERAFIPAPHTMRTSLFEKRAMSSKDEGSYESPSFAPTSG